MTGEPPAKPMTPEDVIRRIEAECAYVDKHGAVYAIAPWKVLWPAPRIDKGA
jgi:hypothetical protein